MPHKKKKEEEKERSSIGLRDVFRIVRSYAKDYRKQILIILVFVIFVAGTEALIPFFLGKFYDNLNITLTNVNFVTILFSAVGLFFIIRFVLIAVNQVADFFQIRFERMLSLGLDFNFRIQVFNHILHLPYQFFGQEKIGALDSKVRLAGNGLDVVIGRVVIRTLPDFLNIIISLLICISIDYRMALILFVGIIFFGIASFIRYQRLAVFQKKSNDLSNEVQGHVLDVLQNISVIKDTAAEAYELERIRYNFADRRFNTEKDVVYYNSTTNLILAIIKNTGSLLILGLGGILVLHEALTVGQLIMYVSYFAAFFNPLQQLAWRWEQVQNGIIAIHEVQDILKKPQEGNASALLLPSVPGTIIFDNVSFGYQDNASVLNNVSFMVSPGMRIALVGKSGGGKSTLIKLLSAYYVPESGNITISDINTREIDIYNLRSRIAVVPQDITLFNETIENNIKYGSFDASREQVVEAARKAHALEFIEAFPDGWDQIVGERGIKLSGGQKQRIAIARAILRNPQILILDEPTSALDAHSEKFITEALQELMKDRTTFIIAHRLSTVRQADMILVLEGGKIVERGTHEELLKNGGTYKELHDLQIGLHE